MASSNKRKHSEVSNGDDRDDDFVFDFTQKTWMSDVTFLVEGKKLYGSRTILGIHSPVFRAMFGSNFRERNEEDIPLPGKRYDDVLLFMKFLLPKCSPEVTVENFRILVPLAHEYQIHDLMKNCDRFVENFVSTRWISIPYLCRLLLTAEKYDMDAAAELISNRLADVDPKDVFASIKQYIEENPEDQNYLLSLQSKMMSKYFNCYKKLQLQVAKSNVGTENIHNYRWEDLQGFEDARGTVAEIQIKESENLAMPLKPGEEMRLISQTIVDVWDASFILSCTVYKGSDDSIFPALVFSLRCGMASSIDKWSCNVKAKFVIRCKHSGTGYNTLYNSTVSFSDSVRRKKLYGSDVAEFLGPSSGFVINNRVEAEVFILANEPTIEAVANEIVP